MKFALTAASLLLLAGCATQQANQAGAPAAPVSSSAKAELGSSSAALEAAKKRLAAVEPSVYFDYDKFEVKKDYSNVVTAFGGYMALDPKAKVRVEGNADERGTTEYNLALGQRRAEAVRAALQAAGANAANIEAISNGEEKPRAMGHNEAAWTQNRRADLVIR
ncbi:MAG: peptidoglycan-associated lipoprotein Pal [Betaproteobacteria bacterium]|nr:peptidoglycan-associated lipoprotein Pal [Betaproteobacteria bacterium]